MSFIRSHILVCTGTGCSSSNSLKIIEEFEKQLPPRAWTRRPRWCAPGASACAPWGPLSPSIPRGRATPTSPWTTWRKSSPSTSSRAASSKRLLNKNDGGDGPATSLSETRFYKHQYRIALRNCGVINLRALRSISAWGGYEALGKILTEQVPPQQVIDTVLASGLRGRGGAGFPTGKKWQFTADAVSPDGVKYVCCNADEGDPGAFMDRSVLEGDPFSVLEAMTIAGYAVGAHQGYIYVRAEYPIAVKRLEVAIGQAKEYGLLGRNIFESGFDFDLELRLGAGAFVCGEETPSCAPSRATGASPRPARPSRR